MNHTIKSAGNMADLYKFSERVMKMDDSAWKRHANPKSVWTRVAVLPLFVLAVWSRVWIGWWAVLPIITLIIFIWWNPRAFQPPVSTRNWASRGTFGERIFLNRKIKPIPQHHQTIAYILTLVSAIGLIPLALGLFWLTPWMALSGLILVVGGKLWFVDRMVWLYEDMKDTDPIYLSWLY